MPDLLRRISGDRRGNVAIITALCLVPLAAMVAFATDSGLALTRRNELQSATDSGALAGLKVLIAGGDDAAIKAAVKKFTAASLGDENFVLSEVLVNRAQYRVEAKTKANVDMIAGSLLSLDTVPVNARSVAKGGGQTVEVAMVLDTSGSMDQGTRIEDLRTASKSFIKVLYDEQLLKNKVTISVVPFSGSVNVGPNMRTAGTAWLDVNGLNPVHGENLDTANNKRFQAFDDLGVAWGGCVESRRVPGSADPILANLDILDEQPNAGKPATLFVPMFAPDEPDMPTMKVGNTTYSQFLNSYKSDDGVKKNGNRKHCTNAANGGKAAQIRSCKYKEGGAAPAHTIYTGLAGISPPGPNFLCDSQPILKLTQLDAAGKSTIDGKLTSLQPKGFTNILEGAMWGWRTLSPGVPFSEGKAYNTENNNKIMIVMTDGVNTWMGNNNTNPNKSFYSTYGFADTGRLKSNVSCPGYGECTQLMTEMDNRLKLACTNAKAAGIRIYTVILTSDNPGESTDWSKAKALMKGCATDPAMAFAPTQSSQLDGVFKEIAASITSIRLTE